MEQGGRPPWTPESVESVDEQGTSSGPIVLVGPPSSGKTTLGRLLAEELGGEFTDVDAVIEERAGKPISDIFTEDGEPEFRRREVQTTIELLGRPDTGRPQVLSLGGGAVVSAEIRAALAPYRVVWLQVGIAAAADRIGLNTARPLLLGNVRGQLIKLMREREPMYAEVATITLATDRREPAELVAAIIGELGAQILPSD